MREFEISKDSYGKIIVIGPEFEVTEVIQTIEKSAYDNAQNEIAHLNKRIEAAWHAKDRETDKLAIAISAMKAAAIDCGWVMGEFESHNKDDLANTARQRLTKALEQIQGEKLKKDK